MRNKFETPDLEISFHGHPNPVLNTMDAKVQMLHWGLEFEVRDWGVKNIMIIVPDQTVLVYGNHVNPDTLEDEDVEVELELKDIETTTLESDSISPHEIEYYKGKVTVSF